VNVMTKVLSVLGLLLAANVSAAAEYEAPADRSAKAILGSAALKGQYYRIQEVVPTDGYTDRWTVKSDFGDFEVVGDGALRKLLGEINAIAELKKISKTKEFVKGLGGAAKAPLSFVKSLATHPVDTVTGIPKGAYAIVETAATAATNTRDTGQDTRVEELLKMSSFKRDLATRLGVDVYSSNKVLQKEMNGVAWAATAGDWAFSVAMLPAGVGGTVVSNVRLTNSVKNMVQQEPAARLRIINGEKLEKMGMPEDLSKQFLDHKGFTPSQKTLIVLNLEGLGGVAGRDAFLTLTLGAQDEAEANLYTAMIQMLRGYHETVSPLVQIAPLNRLTVAQTKAGAALVAAPMDQLTWTERTDRVSGQLKGNYKPDGFNGRFELWLTGTASALARRELEQRGFTVTDRAGTRVEVLEW
jgi:hypothetical protein